MREFLPEEKMNVLRQRLLAGHSVADVCAQHGITEDLLMEWQTRLFMYGDVALERNYLADKAMLREKLLVLAEQNDHKRAIIKKVRAELQALKAAEQDASEPQE